METNLTFTIQKEFITVTEEQVTQERHIEIDKQTGEEEVVTVKVRKPVKVQKEKFTQEQVMAQALEKANEDGYCNVTLEAVNDKEYQFRMYNKING